MRAKSDGSFVGERATMTEPQEHRQCCYLLCEFYFVAPHCTSEIECRTHRIEWYVFRIIIRGFQFNAKNPIRNSDNGRTHKWMCECEIFNDWWWWPPRLLPESCMRKCQNLTDANRTTYCRRRRTQVYLQFIRSQLQCRAACVCAFRNMLIGWICFSESTAKRCKIYLSFCRNILACVYHFACVFRIASHRQI